MDRRRGAAKSLSKDEGSRRISPKAAGAWRLIRISPLPSVRMWSGRRHVLPVRLAKATEPARGFHALFKCCETAVCTAVACPIAINCAPRIVLGVTRTVEHSHCREDTEHKQNKSHRSLTSLRLLTGLTIKNLGRSIL
jgi:hypothetical protein